MKDYEQKIIKYIENDYYSITQNNKGTVIILDKMSSETWTIDKFEK